MLIIVLFLVLTFVLLLVGITDDGVSGMVEDFLKALDMIREYRKGKRKRKKEG
ncbi:MAG: hypothetical protein IIZ93_09250 [Acidaminococcaceae bacterium]|nr:hypothetical protein [Acidaminococcaceae bacterium]